MQSSARSRRSVAFVAAAALALLFVPALVSAHAALVTASPADKSVGQPITEVSGIYSEAMTPNGSSIIVKDATGATVMQGSVDPTKNTRLVARRAAALGGGAYTVAWTSVALDGHLERGTWTFTIAAAASVAPTPAGPSAGASGVVASQPPASFDASAGASGGPTAAPSAGGGTSTGSDVLLPIIVALIILGAGAAYLLSRRGRPSDLG